MVVTWWIEDFLHNIDLLAMHFYLGTGIWSMHQLLATGHHGFDFSLLACV